jgi:hypothetical protein
VKFGEVDADTREVEIHGPLHFRSGGVHLGFDLITGVLCWSSWLMRRRPQ